ncbi:sigma-70 family RNA polymerase sigma factor [Streptomyces sp. NPDC006617]|uniref:sigma-70 family RNA polymerase sigma factor n=1 Tax=Streptomyces sp. NPDC006617 TaxID=3155354 RepID=UPI00339FB011
MSGLESITWHFEHHRPYLRAVAYRMLGSLGGAEDALQDAWLRIRDVDPATIDTMRAWLTTVVGRVCLNALRSARARREQPADFHVPDPVVVLPGDDDPEQRALETDSLGLAMLVVLDTLGPAERFAFVLHDVFGVPFAQLASALDRSEAAVQQLASRARRRVAGCAEPDRDLPRQRVAVDAFFAAAHRGDFEALVAVLAPDVELRIDGGALRADASRALRGARGVAEHTATYSALRPHVRPALVNGAAGAVVVPRGRLFAVMGFTVVDGRIARVDALVDPARLARLRR